MPSFVRLCSLRLKLLPLMLVLGACSVNDDAPEPPQLLLNEPSNISLTNNRPNFLIKRTLSKLAKGDVILKYFKTYLLWGRQIHWCKIATSSKGYPWVYKYDFIPLIPQPKLLSGQGIDYITIIKRGIALYTITSFIFTFKKVLVKFLTILPLDIKI